MTLLDSLYYVNCKLKKDDSLIEALQIKRVLRLCLRRLSNIVLPSYLKKSRRFLQKQEAVPIIVCITSFPQRISKVWLTIESIICQTVQPESIVLWLSRDQFPGGLSDLPSSLIEQVKRGLSIRFVDGDIRSYKKFYYAFCEFPHKLVLTIDDDLYFPSDFVNSIYHCYQENPHCVIASFGFEYEWDREINYIRVLRNEVLLNVPKMNYFFGSGGGTLLDTDVAKYLDPLDVILRLCPTSDDIYLNSLFKLAGYRTVFHMNNPLLSITLENDQTLVSHNGTIGNPQSENANQLHELVQYVINTHHVNPFMNNE